MKGFFENIALLSLIIIVLVLISCNDMSKSCCEEILYFSYSESDSVISHNLDIAKKCSEKYHKRPEYIRKISQIYYYDAILEDSSMFNYQQSARKLYNSLEYINHYFSKIDDVKSYDYQFRGEIYERLGDIYKDVNSLKAATNLYDKALSEYESAGNDGKVLNILIKLGKLYQYNHIPEIAMIYFEMAEERDDIPSNIYRKIIDNIIVTMYELDDYKRADSVFKNNFNFKIQDYDFHSTMGIKYFYERDYENALPHLEFCFEKGSQQEKIVLSEKLAEVHFNLNDQEKEMFYIQYQANYNSIEIRKTPLKLDLEKLFDTNYNVIDNVQNDKEKDGNHIIILFVLLFLILLMFLFFFMMRKSYREKINFAEEAINDNRDEIQSKDKIINDISKKLVLLETKESFDEAYKLFSESAIYIKIKSSFEGKSILIKNIDNYSKLALSGKDMVSLVKTFNNCFPRAITAIKREYETINSNDIKFIILTFMNITDIEIAVLLGVTYGAVNKRNNRIKNIFNTKEDLTTFVFDFVKSNF